MELISPLSSLLRVEYVYISSFFLFFLFQSYGLALMGTYVLQAKTNSYMATDWEKLKGQNGVGEIFSFQLRCLHPAKIFVGAYRKIDKFILLKDLRVTQK